jgi:hypothetical protein
MTVIGYALVSTTDQSLDVQENEGGQARIAAGYFTTKIRVRAHQRR